MATRTSGTNAIEAVSSWRQCWMDSLILAVGIPAAIWVASKVITASVPAAVHGSLEQRFFFWFSAGIIVEWLFVIGLWFVLRRRRASFASLGVWRSALGQRGYWHFLSPPYLSPVIFDCFREWEFLSHRPFFHMVFIFLLRSSSVSLQASVRKCSFAAF